MLSIALWRAAVAELPAAPGPRPASTEGGRGRAELHQFAGDELADRWRRELKATPDPGALSDVLDGYRE